MRPGFCDRQDVGVRVLLLLCGAVLLTGCRKELCYDHDHWTANVVADWELVWERDYGMAWEQSWNSPAGVAYDGLRPVPGKGIAAIVYKEGGSSVERHIGADGGILPLGEGRHSLLFYNDDTEYIVFSGLDTWVEASATTRTRTRSTYQDAHGEESTVNSPDMLFGAWIENYEPAGSPDATPLDLPVTLRPLVYKYVLVYEFESGIEYVKLARGALAGMAQSVFLQDGRTGPDKATVLFDETDIDPERGVVSAVVSTFGVPDFPDRYYNGTTPESESGTFGLNLEVMLPDGSIKVFEFDISEQMADQPRGGVITVSGLTISAGEVGSSGGFDVDVDGWGDYEDIVLPIN